MINFRISVLTFVLGILFASCIPETHEKITIGDKLKEEKEAIDALIAKEGFEILNKYPDNGVFGEKQFVLLDNGCYLNVVDSGSGNRAVLDQTVVLMRCSTIGISKGDNSTFSMFSDSEKPMKFTYGKINEVILNARPDKNNLQYRFLSHGVESALKYVGKGATVRMIIPSFREQQGYYHTIGSNYQITNLIPMYYDRILFQFENDGY